MRLEEALRSSWRSPYGLSLGMISGSIHITGQQTPTLCPSMQATICWFGILVPADRLDLLTDPIIVVGSSGQVAVPPAVLNPSAPAGFFELSFLNHIGAGISFSKHSLARFQNLETVLV